MPASTERPDRSMPTTPSDPTDPIVVDPTGRRLRRGQLIGALVIGLMATYVAVMLLAFLGGSNVKTPNLPPQDPARAAAAHGAPGHGVPAHGAPAQQTHR
ncbi:hypothetical protein [Arthrobacter rhombi]|uniref:hypothetical protein n=1 Tax=Arthrobacter rhombi TaxID=71253 RepID=UPI0031D8EB59